MTGIVIVEAAAKTNSVTTCVGIKLAAFLSTSLRRAPSRDYITSALAAIIANWQMVWYYFESWAAVVYVRI